MRKHRVQDVWVLCLLLTVLSKSLSAAAPHIVFIVADDLGWNDVSFHGSDQIPTPNLDALAYNGIILNSHYVQPLCTPSRAALMTGKYPIHTGMQGLPMYGSEPRGLPAGKILPQYLKDLGYATHAVGKWHLGFCKEEFTPVQRGFDDHLGFWGGSTSYYDHILQDVYPDGTVFSGHDFRRNMDTAWDLDGQYATDVFTNVAVDIINKHSTRTPLFLYISHLAVHAGNVGKSLEAPQADIDKFKYIPEPNRRTYAAMISKLDESVGKVVQALQKKNMLENSIIVFIADNGAPTIGIFQNWGSNYPLRGIKATLWEGGVRGVSLIWSPLIKSAHRVSNELVHISDWLPTLYRAAGGNMTNLPLDLDGKDQWDAFVKNEASPRKNVLLNIDEVLKNAAIREGKWKLVIGTYGINGSFDGYSGESGSETNNPVYDASKVTSSPTWQSLKTVSRALNIASDAQISDLRKAATIKCGEQENNPTTSCNPSVTNQPCLFDIDLDPCETTNLARRHVTIAKKLYYFLASEKRTLTPQLNKPLDLIGADPAKHNNTWVPWLSKSV